MKLRLSLLLLGVALAGLAAPAAAQDPVYRERNEYPVLDEIEAARDAIKAARDSVRQAVDDLYAAEKKARDEARLDLRVDWTQVERPGSPDDFRQVWHTPPTPQFYTGSCWAFCSVSMMESEARRLAGEEVKLSEMWVVYWEYVEKCRSHLRTFGHTPVDEGSQDHGTLEILRRYGLVTRDAYPGVLDEQGRHDHTPLVRELKAYLKFVLDSGSWDEEQNLAYVRSILDKHLGAPPQAVQWRGKTWSPRDFAAKVLKLDADDYVACVSRMDQPFHARVLLDVHDNWRRKDDYLNLPLDEFYGVIEGSIRAGYTLAIGGDNSEPGMDGRYDAAIIPAWDIPREDIDQAAREFRIVNGTTGDDHGVHIVGFTQTGGRDWFLVKDSNRSSRLGQYEGYYFWSDDYVRLKMLSFTVHKDRLRGLAD